MLADGLSSIFCPKQSSAKRRRSTRGAMDFLQAFPVAIIDEDYDGKRAAGRGMRQLAAAIEQEGFRVVADLSYDDARRLVNVANNESCWLVSVDGIEAEQTRWQILEQVLLAKRRRNDRLPIFLFGDEVTAEMVPSSVPRHRTALMQCFKNPSRSLSRAIPGWPTSNPDGWRRRMS